MDQPRRWCSKSTSLSTAHTTNGARIAAPRFQALVSSSAARTAASPAARGLRTLPTIETFGDRIASFRSRAPMQHDVTNGCHDRFSPQKLNDATHEDGLM